MPEINVEGAFEADPIPRGGDDLIRYAGGRRSLVEQLSGMGGPPQRADYATPADLEAARRRWRSASRRVQRISDEGKAGKQRRGMVKGVELTPDQRNRVAEEQLTRKLALLWARGGRMRISATVSVSSPGKRGDRRSRLMPAGGPGVYVTPDEIDATYRENDAERSGWDLLEVFWNAYGGPDDAEFDEIEWVRLWPEGTREPA